MEMERPSGLGTGQPTKKKQTHSWLRAALAGAVSGLLACCLFTGCPKPAPTVRPGAATESTSDDSSGRSATPDQPTGGSGDAAETDPARPTDGTGPSKAGKTEPQSHGTDNPAGNATVKDTPNDAHQQPEGTTIQEGSPTNSTPKAGAGLSKKTRDSGEPEWFADWERPEVVLVVTGEQHGYIEPCGCTGLANQKGGLARRYSLLESLRKRGWDVLPIDAGTQIRRYGIQAEIKFQSTIAGLRQMGYQAVALGPDDLRLSATLLAGLVVPTGDEPPLFFSSSAKLFGDDSFIPPVKILEAKGVQIGVAAVVAPSRAISITGDDVAITPADEAVAAVVDRLEPCRWKVLIVQGTREEAEQLARKHDRFDIVVCSGEPGEPLRQPAAIEGSRAKLILTGYKAMYAGVIGLSGEQMQYQRVPLDARFPDAPPMLQLLADYQNTLKIKGLEGLGIRPIPHPSGREFVGSAACADCHEEAFAVWKEGIDGKGGPHAHATETLVHPGERSEIPRHYDPECLSCHVTGWNPQQYYPYETGYLDLEKSKHLTGNGCENCHGPGSQHVAAENGDIEADDALLEKLRAELRRSLEKAEQQCMECHDLDNSPDFHVRGAFEKYWDQIRH